MSRWLAYSLDMLVIGYIGIHACLAIFGKDLFNIDPALIAMSLNVSADLGGLLQFSVRLYVEMENSFTSV